MTEIQPAPRHSVRETDQRHCPQCQAPMDMAPHVPGLGHLAGRIFECSKCGHVQIAPEP
jgi:ribosomal protein S27AE